MNWDGENNYACPPICLILRVLIHMRNCKASGSLIVPLWHSAPFWPIICPDGRRFASVIVDWNFPHSKKPTFPVVVIACLETKFESPLRLLGIFIFSSMYTVFLVGVFCFLCTLGAVRPPVSTRQKILCHVFCCCFARVWWC